MAKNLGRDFSRLAKSSNPVDPRAPWWVNWLMQLAIGLFGLWLIATAADWLWVKLTGQPLGLWCQAVALIPGISR